MLAQRGTTLAILFLALLGHLPAVRAEDDVCAVDDASKLDCGYVGIDEDGCTAKGCCWHEAEDSSDVPWCYYKSGATSNCFLALSGDAQSPFSDSEVSQMLENFQANIDVNGTGAVCAAPDTDTPGGSYYYHWERDGALTMRALQRIVPISTALQQQVQHYAMWVVDRDSLDDPNDIDVRTEPKYEIPSGDVYTGAWCRPQNDGPGLRALALMDAVDNALLDDDFVSQYLWTSSDDDTYHGGGIKYNLDFIVSGYEDSTCDLWEEVQSTDFFWNRVTARAALIKGSTFAQAQGDTASAASYAAAATKINATLTDHWNGDYITEESSNRPLDGSVIVTLANFIDDDDAFFAPSSIYVANTVESYINAFCAEYPINSDDTANGVPGVLLGRYPGDTYAGGNPWILISSALAQLLYRVAECTATVELDKETMQAWQAALPGIGNATSQDFIKAGDAVLLRVRNHVKADDFRLDEQIDKNSGSQTSAKSLTWSYAETLLAVEQRSKVASELLSSPITSVTAQS